MFHDLVTIFLHHLARHRAQHAGFGQPVNEAGLAVLQLETNGVTVQRPQPLHFGVVVKPGTRFFGIPAQGIHAQQFELFHVRINLALGLGIKDALKCIDKVLRGQLALFATKGRIVGKVNAGLDLDGEGLEVIGDDWHAIRHIGNNLGGARQIVVAVQRVEHVLGGCARVVVGDLCRVEAGFRNFKRVAQYLLWLRFVRWLPHGRQTPAQHGHGQP